jgi:hypothetical protein
VGTKVFLFAMCLDRLWYPCSLIPQGMNLPERAATIHFHLVPKVMKDWSCSPLLHTSFLMWCFIKYTRHRSTDRSEMMLWTCIREVIGSNRLGNDRFLPDPFQSTNHPTVWHYVASILKPSSNAPTPTIQGVFTCLPATRHYSPGWALASSTTSLHCSLSLIFSFHPFISIFFKSLSTSYLYLYIYIRPEVYIVVNFHMVTCMCVTVDGVLDWWMDLLTTHTHDSELQLITAPPLISTVYKSP